MSEFIPSKAMGDITGRVTYRPEIKAVGKTKLFELRIPIDTTRKNKDTGERETIATTWYACKFWGDKAEEAAALDLAKGDVVRVVGRQEQSVWKDKTGADRQSFEIAWPEIEVLQKGKPSRDDEDEI